MSELNKSLYFNNLHMHGTYRPVTYCTIGYRSGLFTKELRQRGFEAYNLVGSILAWTHAGEPLEDPAGEETRRVHVYGKKWALAARGYEETW